MSETSAAGRADAPSPPAAEIVVREGVAAQMDWRLNTARLAAIDDITRSLQAAGRSGIVDGGRLDFDGFSGRAVIDDAVLIDNDGTEHRIVYTGVNGEYRIHQD